MIKTSNNMIYIFVIIPPYPSQNEANINRSINEYKHHSAINSLIILFFLIISSTHLRILKFGSITFFISLNLLPTILLIVKELQF